MTERVGDRPHRTQRLLKDSVRIGAGASGAPEMLGTMR